MVQKSGPKTLIDTREHTLYCGVTLTGKTTLARFHAQKLAAGKHDVIVYDPVRTGTINGDWPEGAKILTIPETFHEEMERINGDEEHPVFLFVDESADIFGHTETHAHWIPRQCRHRNIYLRMMVQRPKMLHPSVRTQCAFAYMFRVSRDDARNLCADFGHGSDVADTPLDRGDCILLESGTTEIVEFNVFDLIGRKLPQR